MHQNADLPTSTKEHTFLNPSEAASYLRLSLSTLAKLRVYGGGPVYFKLRRRIQYDLKDLDEWIGARRLDSTSAEGR